MPKAAVTVEPYGDKNVWLEVVGISRKRGQAEIQMTRTQARKLAKNLVLTCEEQEHHMEENGIVSPRKRKAAK